ncbi:hypothetical protein BD626DRAFT_495678 [Schizophyllum amplum]|uniref:Uncharacterized protein n=1 Tax=Schizophyllum amplum TaxID=97359 RepID=A0A550CEE7_9AGAR|nr:hypothetical protein BD626DRAFT_495678 [Auriculariopsis ampla]
MGWAEDNMGLGGGQHGVGEDSMGCAGVIASLSSRWMGGVGGGVAGRPASDEVRTSDGTADDCSDGTADGCSISDLLLLRDSRRRSIVRSSAFNSCAASSRLMRSAGSGVKNQEQNSPKDSETLVTACKCATPWVRYERKSTSLRRAWRHG